jgi:hypothetical protein
LLSLLLSLQVPATRRIKVEVAPNVLALLLKRFGMHRFGKINRRVVYQETLDLAPFKVCCPCAVHAVCAVLCVLCVLCCGHAVLCCHWATMPWCSSESFLLLGGQRAACYAQLHAYALLVPLPFLLFDLRFQCF